MAYQCVLNCGSSCVASEVITAELWGKLKLKAEDWKGLDKFGSVFENTPWDQGPDGFHVHNSCYITLSSKRSLQQSKTRKEKANSNSRTESPEIEPEKECQPSSPKRLRSSIGGPLHTKEQCVWCMKGPDTKHPNRRNAKLMRISTASGWREFKRHTVWIEDEMLRLRLSRLVESTDALSDAFAADIMYHHSCYLDHITNRFSTDEGIHLQNVTYSEMKHLFLRRVDEIIFTEHEIRSLQSLLREYKQIAAEYGFPVGKVKSSYVKDVLIKEYGDGIGFHERNEKNKSELVYDTKGGGNYIEAALNSFGITHEQLIHNLAPRLSKKIKEAPIVNWPPRIDELENDESMCQLILTLFSKLKPKRRNKDSAADESPVLRTLASLITYFVTGKRTSTAVNLAVLIHGMTRSRELIDLLHKCGLCISYTDLLLLYDAWALEDAEASETCPVGIAADKPPIVIVDNDDFKIDTLTGNAGGAHRTNVLYVQPASYEEERVYAPETIRHTNKKEITKQLDEKCKKLTAVQQYMCPRDASREPPVRDRVCAPVNGPRPQRIRSVIHALVRADPEGERPSVENQTVPSYSGFQSCLLPSTRKSKPYYHATYNEPPKKSVMNDIMAKLVQTMGEKNMPFAFLVGDLPTYKLIVELKSENPNKYFDIVPTIGAFHQQMSFIYAIYKRFLGSGISELMVSAGVIVEGSVDQALRGKHYRRGLRCIMLWREALIHKRVNMFLENEYLSTSIKENMETLRNALHENKDNLASAYSDLETDEDIRLLVDAVYMKPSTDIGDYWLSFMEMSDILLQNVDACHVGNFDEYLSSTHDMLPGLLAYNNHDYGRWLPDYWAAMSSLPYEKKKFFSEHFSQSMTGLPYSCQPMDLWIEVTMNLNSKLKQGWLQLLQNDKQLFCTTRNANNVGRVKTLMKNNLNCQRRYQRHVECQPARMKKDERAVQDLLTCTDEFEADPFDNTLPDLRSLQSGVTASPEIQLDLQNALEEGKKQADDILEKRVFSKELILSATISKNKRLNLASTPVTTSAGSNCSIAEMEMIGLAALMDCAEKNDLIDLETLLDRRVTEECLTMFNVNGSLRKTAKSKLLQSFSRQPQMEHPASYVGLVDMGLIWRLASPTSDDRDHKKRCGAEYTWQDYLDKVCSMVFSRHGNAEKLILINDNYTVSSIKDDEHDRRASKHTNIPNVYPKDSDKFPSPAQFKSIMMKSENKVRLQKLLKNRFRARIHDVIGEIIYCEGEAAENLTNGHENDDFVFEQAEADTMLLSAYGKLRDSYDGPVVIDSEDTDVYVQAAYVAHILPGNLYIKNKNSLFNCVELVSNSVSKVIVPFHVLTGCDHTSVFYGRGKKKIFDKLMKDSEGQELLREVGDSLILDENTRQNMKKFILWKVYGEHVDTCGKARASKWRKMKKKSMARLPPDEDTLNHHCDRTNYISFCLKHFELDRHPPPIGHGWAFLNGRCRPIRHTKSAMPEFVREFDPRPLLSDDSDSEYGESSDDSDSDQD